MGVLWSFILPQRSFSQVISPKWSKGDTWSVILIGTIFILSANPDWMTEKDLSSWKSSFSKKVVSTKEWAAAIGDKQEDASSRVTPRPTGKGDYNKGIEYMNQGLPKEAISQFQNISKDSPHYKKAQKDLRSLKKNLYLEEVKEVSYGDLQKKPNAYKGVPVHLYGEVYNIQEISGKTLLTLSTTIYGEKPNYGQEALILFPKTTPIQQGDYLDIYGDMVGNYGGSDRKIGRYVKDESYVIYFTQSTFVEQAPVIETRVIVDLEGKMKSHWLRVHWMVNKGLF